MLPEDFFLVLADVPLFFEEAFPELFEVDFFLVVWVVPVFLGAADASANGTAAEPTAIRESTTAGNISFLIDILKKLLVAKVHYRLKQNHFTLLINSFRLTWRYVPSLIGAISEPPHFTEVKSSCAPN